MAGGLAREALPDYRAVWVPDALFVRSDLVRALSAWAHETGCGYLISIARPEYAGKTLRGWFYGEQALVRRLQQAGAFAKVPDSPSIEVLEASSRVSILRVPAPESAKAAADL